MRTRSVHRRGQDQPGGCCRSCQTGKGIESVVLENRSRDYIESASARGLIEHGRSDCWLRRRWARACSERECSTMVYIRLRRRFALHQFSRAVGKGPYHLRKQEVVRIDDRRLADVARSWFEASDVSVHEFAGQAHEIRLRQKARTKELARDFHRRLRRPLKCISGPSIQLM